MYSRSLKQQLKNKFFQGKILILAGARQTGKTTLSLELIGEFEPQHSVRTFNCDNPTDRAFLTNHDFEFLDGLIGDAGIVFIDEGQKVNTIGQTIKLLVDHYGSRKQILVTGSSSLHLLEQTQEALTGRKYVYHLFPLSFEEIVLAKGTPVLIKELESLLIFGSYPDIMNHASFDQKKELLESLAGSALYKDIFEFQQVRNPDVLRSLLKALALQIGSEVSYRELSSLVGVDQKTIERYIDLLEKNFIVFRLPPYSKQSRRSISRLKKVFFYDLGIRNAVINNFNFLEDRSDVGALWENLMMVERLKYRTYHQIYTTAYFWRTYDGSEVDLVEDRDGRLYGYEFKWKQPARKPRPPSRWLEYPGSIYQVVTSQNLKHFAY